MSVIVRKHQFRRKRQLPPEIEQMLYKPKSAEDFRQDYLDEHLLETAPASPVAGIPISRDTNFVAYVKRTYPKDQWNRMLFGVDEPGESKSTLPPPTGPRRGPVETPPSETPSAEVQVGQELGRQLEQKYGSGVRALAQQKHPQQSQPSPRIPAAQEKSPLETKCLYCGKPIVSTPGHRRRRYCSGSCRVKACQQRKSPNESIGGKP